MTTAGDDSATTLTNFQREVARTFFDLEASHGFLLAGGAALIAQRLVARHTQDLDLFTHEGASTVAQAVAAFEQVARQRGWDVERIRESSTFCRLRIIGSDTLIVDLALDAPPRRGPASSEAGPTFDPVELAARKVLADGACPHPSPPHQVRIAT